MNPRILTIIVLIGMFGVAMAYYMFKDWLAERKLKKMLEESRNASIYVEDDHMKITLGKVHYYTKIGFIDWKNAKGLPLNKKIVGILYKRVQFIEEFGLTGDTIIRAKEE